MTFEILRRSESCGARRGRLLTPHGAVETPAFMPVGTQGTVKGISQQELRELEYSLLLGNAYHLHLRPGEDCIRRAGGLHAFMGWDGAILTDSGGFQVFSLQGLRRVTDDGVRFRSHVDGSERFFSPETVVDVQRALGSDIMMVLDECVANPCSYDAARAAMERTHRWAARAHDRWMACRKVAEVRPALFGIVQGSRYLELRTESAREIAAIGFDGVAIGGVSVGEPREEMVAVVRHTAPLLPDQKLRYLMGVGTPEDLLEAIGHGIDLFDCVLPTRLGRNGTAYTARGRVNVKGAQFTEEFGPIDSRCPAWCCRNYPAAYVRHLYKSKEMMAARLLTYHNLGFYSRLLGGVRAALEQGRFERFREDFLRRFAAGGGADADLERRQPFE